MKELTVDELKSMMDNKEYFQLIDVREEYEYDIVNIGGELIPLNTFIDNPDKVNREIKTVVHCKSGARSAVAIRQLESKFGFTNLYNLKGGIIAWAKLIDTSFPVY